VQRRSKGAVTFDKDWRALVVAASALDPAWILQGRDFARMVLRARSAGVELVPVLLTSPSVPRAQRDRALRTLAAACGVDPDDGGGGGVQVVVMSDELLAAQGLAAAPCDVPLEGSSADGDAAIVRARQQMVCNAPGAAAVRQQLQEVLRRHQAILSLPQQNAVVAQL